MRMFHFLRYTILLGLFLPNVEAHKPDWIKSPVIDSERIPFITAIKMAKKTLALGSYKLHAEIKPNDELIEALKEAKARNVEVTIIVEDRLTPEEQKVPQKSEIKEGDSFKIYQDLGIKVVHGNPKFNAVHEKILMGEGDGSYAIVGNTNFDKNFQVTDSDDKNVTKVTRDFALFLWDPKILHELDSVFQSDITQKGIVLKPYLIQEIPENEYRLSWGPDQHYSQLLEMIKSAEKRIDIYQQALQDEEITHALAKASQRGVEIRLLMSKYPFGEKHGNKSEIGQEALKKAGGKVRLTGDTNKEKVKLHIHAKVMIVDGGLMYLGSANFHTESLEKSRQVGVITRDPTHIKPVQERFLKDWTAEEKETTSLKNE
ncbi:Cls and PLDc_SF domain-containing protein [Candidatus Bealeia paramacronuclearis]|uniref:Phospholipase D n=1 Tax=Candidatus Bealeia paramacronuclearis TaxID=1921001 RepID=A0ABZ2C6Q8_9PROT|nr:Cls and PLDc_SF domain-containing protein [Candidatus Bealeia paramacronuclearis]